MRADIARALSGRPVAPPVAPVAQTERVAPPLAVPGTATFPVVQDVDRRDKGGRTLAYILLAIAVLAVFVIAALVGKSLFGGGTVRVQVPDVRGLTVAQATTAITKAGLTVGQVTQENSGTVDKGNVIDQSPEPRSELGKGGPVDLKVSAGVKESTVPTLVGLSLDEASNALRDAGLQLGTTKAVPSDKPQNVVVKADPAEGKNVAAGSKVNLEYASGNNKVPKVTGMSADQARSALQDAGFQVTEQEREDATHPPGTVIEQSPAAGKAARLDSTVRIIVAKAPPPTPTDTASLPTPTIT
jgi:serine/threonine-protein kinase